MRVLIVWSLLLIPFHALVLAGETHSKIRDAYFGEALYYAKQGEYFDAIARVDTELRLYYGVDEPQLDTLHFHINEAEFSAGDFELYYRMHRKAGRAIQAVIEGSVAPEVRNEAIYRLAKIYFQKEQNINALHAIERIEGRVPKGLSGDIEFLKGQIYMVNGRFKEAEKLFKSLQSEGGFEGYSGYNLGLIRIAQGNSIGAAIALEETGRINTNDRDVLAIKDKANLMLGSRLIDAGNYPEATKYLERVRIDGPYSNRALLGLGWANAAFENYENALVPWSIVSQRHVTDPPVQDAMLSVPYAYGKLGLYGKAALGYGHALEAMNGELDRLDASIQSIKEGKFLKALVREEFKQDRNWVVKLRDLPETPETYYLMDLMASHDFQSSLQNYFDLDQLRKKLELWSDYYASYDEMIAIRRAYYEPLLPSIDEKFRKLDSLINLRLEQRDRISSRLQALLVSPRPELLATADERISLISVEAFEQSPKNSGPDTQARVDRLKGYIRFNWSVEYDERLTVTFENLAELDKDIASLKTIYESFVRTRQAATQSYEGYDKTIKDLRLKTEKSLKDVKTLMLRQGRMLEVMAVNELQQRSQTLEASQVKARFALAESYDQATMSKSNAGDKLKTIKKVEVKPTTNPVKDDDSEDNINQTTESASAEGQGVL